MKYLHDGLYTAVGPLHLHLKPQHIFGTHLALGVQHAALDIPLHLHPFTWGKKRQTQTNKEQENIKEGCQTEANWQNDTEVSCCQDQIIMLAYCLLFHTFDFILALPGHLKVKCSQVRTVHLSNIMAATKVSNSMHYNKLLQIPQTSDTETFYFHIYCTKS